MSTDLIAEIRSAKEDVKRLELEASEAAHKVRMLKGRLKDARQTLDEVLEELISGQSKRYTLPGFDSEAPADNGQLPSPSGAQGARPPTAPTGTAPPRGKGRRAKEPHP